MRRTAVLAAAAASVISVGLGASAGAVQVQPGRTLSGSTTCDQGQARLVTTVDKAGTERGTVTLSGLGSKRWRGGLQLNPSAALMQADDGDDETLTHDELVALMGGARTRHLAKHGRISVSARLKDSRSLDAQASFASPVISTCSIGVASRGGQFMVMGDGMLSVRAAGRHPMVQAMFSGEGRHRYRVTVAMTTRTGTQTRILTRTAGSPGMLPITVKDFKGLAGFTEVSVTAEDLTVALPAQTMTLGR